MTHKKRTAKQKAADKKNGERLKRFNKKHSAKKPARKAARKSAKRGPSKATLAAKKRELKKLKAQIAAGKKKHKTAHKRPKMGRSSFIGVSINDTEHKGHMPLSVLTRRFALLSLEISDLEKQTGQTAKPYIAKGDSARIRDYLSRI
jgi:hypothetical protein